MYSYFEKYVEYDKDSGVFRRKKVLNDDPRHIWRVGDILSKQGDDYYEIAVGYEKVLAHRLAYWMVTGEVCDMLDHINGDRSDNRFINLRPVTGSQNQRNRKLSKNNTSGYTGISLTKNGRYRVRVRDGNSLLSLGTYNTISEAVKVRDEHYRINGFTERHGK